ncbi:transposase, partial [Aquimarina sp. I32.4]|uniref:transposase n=1 Tax=Aquimarina sp. I32.4 TaxID=2053903 RepID=UPI000CDED809
MGKHILLEVKESSSHLRNLIRKETNPKNVLRLQSLLHIRESSFSTQSALAEHLGYHVRSMELWLKLYKEGGLFAMLLNSKEKQQRKRIITPAVHDGLSKRLNNPEQGFHSYVKL